MSANNKYIKSLLLVGQFPYNLIRLRKCLTGAQSRVPNLTTLQSAECHRALCLGSLQFQFGAVTTYLHELNHKCTSAQLQNPDTSVLSPLPMKNNTSCHTRLSEIEAHWSVPILGLDVLRKSWVSQEHKKKTFTV